MLNLKNITLWSAVWTRNSQLLDRTVRVLNYCRKLCSFQKVILFNCMGQVFTGIETVNIPTLDIQGWNMFVNRIVPMFITDFSMSVHEDGFILDVNRWKPEFLQYDYIGSPWPDGNVGNGGFNIESKKMNQAKMMLPFSSSVDVKTPSDDFVCKHHRKFLESRGVVFAPFFLARDFSTEMIGNENRSFGFHGRKFSPAKYQEGWRLIEKSEKP